MPSDKARARAREIRSNAGDRAHFMRQCMDQMIDDGEATDRDDARTICELLWDEGEELKMSNKDKMVYKTAVASDAGHLEYIMSDATPDRYGDVIVADGWDLRHFKNNPIALFNHNPNFVIGTWSNLRTVNGQLRGNLKLAPEGTSERINEIIRLINADILKAVSVGFLPKKAEPRKNMPAGSGLIYTEQELAECSVCAIGANPNALQVAKSMKISRDTLDLVFAEHGNQKPTIVKRSGLPGEHAATNPKSHKERPNMTPIAKRIEAAQQRIAKLKEQLDANVQKMDDENPDAAIVTINEELSEKIKAQETVLKSLQAAEVSLGQQAADDAGIDQQQQIANGNANGNGGGLPVVKSHNGGFRPFAVPAKKVTPADYVFRALTVAVKHYQEKGRNHILDVIKSTYGEDEGTRVMVSNLVTRAATVPADTTTSGWAAELVQTGIAEFMEQLTPVSVYARLSGMGGRFTFGRNGIVSMPSRASTPTIAGSFVGQGAPIPVRQGAFAAITLTPKKMAVISTFTREISEHSTPAIEQLIRQAMIDDTATAIDSVLLDANAATAVRPAGLLNSVAPISATSGGGIAALIGDLQNLTAALIGGTLGNIRSPLWIMRPEDVLKASLLTNAGGDMPFREELSRGQLLGYPVVQSTNVTADTLILVDAADFVSATGDTPRFDVSDQAVLHMEDTTPLAIGTTGSPTVVAAPTRSLWQTDSLAIRMILDMNWAMRRTGMVRWTQTQTWN